MLCFLGQWGQGFAYNPPHVPEGENNPEPTDTTAAPLAEPLSVVAAPKALEAQMQGLDVHEQSTESNGHASMDTRKDTPLAQAARIEKPFSDEDFAGLAYKMDQLSKAYAAKQQNLKPITFFLKNLTRNMKRWVETQPRVRTFNALVGDLLANSWNERCDGMRSLGEGGVILADVEMRLKETMEGMFTDVEVDEAEMIERVSAALRINEGRLSTCSFSYFSACRMSSSLAAVTPGETETPVVITLLGGDEKVKKPLAITPLEVVEEGATTINNLPTEILARILGFVISPDEPLKAKGAKCLVEQSGYPMQKLFALRLVNKAFRAAFDACRAEFLVPIDLHPMLQTIQHSLPGHESAFDKGYELFLEINFADLWPLWREVLDAVGRPPLCQQQIRCFATQYQRNALHPNFLEGVKRSFPFLRQIYLKNADQLSESVDFSAFDCLTHLDLEECAGFSSLEGLSSLVDLCVGRCAHLTDITHLPSLRRLVVYACARLVHIDVPSVRHVCLYEHQDTVAIPHRDKANAPQFPHLHSLLLNQCPQVVCIQNLPAEVLNVTHCGALTHIQGMDHVRDVTLEHCAHLTHANVSLGEKLEHLTIDRVPSLGNVGLFGALLNLKTLNIRDEAIGTTALQDFPCLEKVTCHHMPDLTVIQNLSRTRSITIYAAKNLTVMQNLPRLTSLVLGDSGFDDGVPHLADMSEMPCLKTALIGAHESVFCLPFQGDHLDLPALRSLSLMSCSNVEIISSDVPETATVSNALECLYVYCGKSLQEVSRLQNLKTLKLEGWEIDDEMQRVTLEDLDNLETLRWGHSMFAEGASAGQVIESVWQLFLSQYVLMEGTFPSLKHIVVCGPFGDHDRDYYVRRSDVPEELLARLHPTFGTTDINGAPL